MFPRSLFSLLVCASALYLGACQPRVTSEQATVLAAIQENTAAMQREDVPGVIATIHPDNPNMEEAKKLFADLFKRYELKYTVSGLKILSLTPTEAKVSFIQKTEKIAGDETFTDNTIEGVHTLKKDGEKWKFTKTVQTKMTALNPFGD